MHRQILLAVAASVAAVLCWTVSPNPLAPLAVGGVVLSVALALRWPSWILLLFIVFSIFRLHEVIAVLAPLQIPLALSVLGLAAVGWHLTLSHQIRPHMTAELKAFMIFITLCSIGILWAKSFELAYSYWTENLLKLVAITLALSWGLRSPTDYRVATYMIALSGTLVGAVAIFNKVSGTGLVELTRVTVASELGSPLGDPNILALTLAFSLSFCVSLLLSNQRAIDTLLGIIGTGVVVAGVVCTQSRGGLLGVLAILGVSTLRVTKLRTVLLVLLPIVAAGLYFTMDLSGRVSGGAADMGDESANGRLYAWSAAINMALDRPFTGVGLDNFVNEFYTYTDVWLDHPITAHSTWFQVLGETGFLGITAFLAMVVLTFVSAIRTLRALRQRSALPDVQGFAYAVTAGLVGFSVAGSFLSEAYDWSLYVLLAFASSMAWWESSAPVSAGVAVSQPKPISASFARRTDSAESDTALSA